MCVKTLGLYMWYNYKENCPIYVLSVYWNPPAYGKYALATQSLPERLEVQNTEIYHSISKIFKNAFYERKRPQLPEIIIKNPFQKVTNQPRKPCHYAFTQDWGNHGTSSRTHGNVPCSTIKNYHCPATMDFKM